MAFPQRRLLLAGLRAYCGPPLPQGQPNAKRPQPGASRLLWRRPNGSRPLSFGSSSGTRQCSGHPAMMKNSLDSNICAIIGGTFTVAGILDSCIFTASEAWKKIQLGKIH
ncbi:hypothetical protein U0070_014175 [Myodes glareolus]|uniref:Uncharacterized protein n=1 Tax=Myodes glareolus TaxID=447135 RepID=A0AAW0INH8_MYOGA